MAFLAAITIVGIILTVAIVLLLLALVVPEIVFAVLAFLAASRGELYRYPFNLDLIKG